MSTRALLGLIGGVLLIILVFLPVVNPSILGTMTFYNYSYGAGLIVIAAGALAITACLRDTARLSRPGAIPVASQRGRARLYWAGSSPCNAA